MQRREPVEPGGRHQRSGDGIGQQPDGLDHLLGDRVAMDLHTHRVRARGAETMSPGVVNGNRTASMTESAPRSPSTPLTISLMPIGS
jgi:hypothetical protein